MCDGGGWNDGGGWSDETNGGSLPEPPTHLLSCITPTPHTPHTPPTRRNTVILQHQYPLYDTHIALSAVDGLLLLHHRNTHVTVVVDVCKATPGPLGEPLPMTLEPPVGGAAGGGDGVGGEGDMVHPVVSPAAAAPSSSSKTLEAAAPSSSPIQRGPEYVDLGTPLPPDTATQPSTTPTASAPSFATWLPQSSSTTTTHTIEATHTTASQPTRSVYTSGQWRFEQPNVLLDVAQGRMYCVHVDLRGLAQAASMDMGSLLGVLLRRSNPQEPLLPRELTISLLRVGGFWGGRVCF